MERLLTLDGSGYGYGYGSGDGYGSGYGDLALRALARAFIPDLTDLRVLALWKSRVDGMPANGGSAEEPARPGLRQSVTGPLELCTGRCLHATLQPSAWKGERLWIVALEGDIVADAQKMGALTREILCEVPTSRNGWTR